MKRFLAIAAVIILCVSISYAQFDFHVFAGVNSSSLGIDITGSPTESDKNRVEEFYGSSILPYIGFKGEYDLSKSIALNLESQLSYKGQKSNKIDFNERSLYIDLIPSIDFKLFSGVRLGLGVYGSLRMHTYFSEKFTVSELGFYRDTWDYGGVASVSFELNRMTLRASYFHGLHKINTTLEYFGFVHRRYRVYQFGIGYRISSGDTEGK